MRLPPLGLMQMAMVLGHYDGDRVSYYSIEDGFTGNQVTGIAEGLDKNIWFATDLGIVYFDWSIDSIGGKKFTNNTSHQHFEGERFWSIYSNSNGIIWAGSSSCIYKYDGIGWMSFDLPYPVEGTGSFITKATTWSITEDRHGNMWFGTNGYGAFKFDGQSFTQYSEKDGLTDNSVDVIMEDSHGDIWFGTRFGGVSRYDGKTFTNYTANDSIGNDEVCDIYEDSYGDIWLSSEGYGVYRYDGKSFTNYSENEGLGILAVQTIYQDREGRIWVGGGGGLYRFLGGTFFNVTKEGPWY